MDFSFSFFRRGTCAERISKGKKLQAREETVQNEVYSGLPVFLFYVKPTRCLPEITFKVKCAAGFLGRPHGLGARGPPIPRGERADKSCRGQIRARAVALSPPCVTVQRLSPVAGRRGTACGAQRGAGDGCLPSGGGMKSGNVCPQLWKWPQVNSPRDTGSGIAPLRCLCCLAFPLGPENAATEQGHPAASELRSAWRKRRRGCRRGGKRKSWTVP